MQQKLGSRMRHSHPICRELGTFPEESLQPQFLLLARSLAASPEALGVRLAHREQARVVS
jgi:hypothetical protein